MKKEEKDLVEKEILTEIDQIKLEIKELEELTKPIAPDVSLGRLTRMEALNEKSINEASLRKARQTLNSLETILLKINDEDFGLCFICKNPIPIKRLLRVPESNRCINCVNK